MEILITLIVILMAYLFRKQLHGLVILGRNHIDKKLPTSVRIEQALKLLTAKQNTVKQTYNEINTYIEKLNFQIYHEIKASLQFGENKVKALHDAEGYISPEIRVMLYHNKYDGVIKSVKSGEIYTVSSYENNKYYLSECGCYYRFDANIFEMINDNKHSARVGTLTNISKSYIERAGKIRTLIDTIQKSIISLQADLEYVKTMESLINISSFENDVNLNIDNIKAEITAIEKQLVMEDELSQLK